MGNLFNSLENVKLPTVNVNAQLDESSMRNLFITVIVAGTLLMIIYTVLFNK